MTNEKRTGDTSRKENYVLSCAGRSAKNKVRNQKWEIGKLEAGECIIPKSHEFAIPARPKIVS
jgi:hypothetical protein